MRHTFVSRPLWYLLDMVRVDLRVILILKFFGPLLRAVVLRYNIVARVILDVHRHFRKPYIRLFGSVGVSGGGRPLPLLVVKSKSWIVDVLLVLFCVFDYIAIQILWKLLLVVLYQVFHIESRFGKLWLLCLGVRSSERVWSVKYWVLVPVYLRLRRD